MKDSISRLLARTRALFSRRTAPETPVAPIVPPPPEEPAPEPFRPHCGVYVWATAHGIDIQRSSKLLTCTCSAHSAHPADGEALRAKVREVNARSTWGR
ncbi:hypothetical protein [Streptomyces abikoensis]